jgi:hypothetical protein
MILRSPPPPIHRRFGQWPIRAFGPGEQVHRGHQRCVRLLGRQTVALSGGPSRATRQNYAGRVPLLGLSRRHVALAHSFRDDMETMTSAVFFGIGFIIGGIMELAVAAVAPGWKWLYILIGVVSIVAGFIALVWPGQTFLVLGAITGWLLLFYGIIDVVFAFSTRHLESLWWMQLVSGILMVALGFWRSGSALRPCSAASPTSSSASGCAPLTENSRA